jgi:hypothetical protein
MPETHLIIKSQVFQLGKGNILENTLLKTGTTTGFKDIGRIPG